MQTKDSKGDAFQQRLERDITVATNVRSGISFTQGVKKAFSVLTGTKVEKPAKDE